MSDWRKKTCMSSVIKQAPSFVSEMTLSKINLDSNSVADGEVASPRNSSLSPPTVKQTLYRKSLRKYIDCGGSDLWLYDENPEGKFTDPVPYKTNPLNF